MAHYTLQKSYDISREIYLIMINSVMMHKKYISQICEKYATLDKKKKEFQIFNSVNMKKKPRWILTHALLFTSPII